MFPVCLLLTPWNETPVAGRPRRKFGQYHWPVISNVSKGFVTLRLYVRLAHIHSCRLTKSYRVSYLSRTDYRLQCSVKLSINKRKRCRSSMGKMVPFFNITRTRDVFYVGMSDMHATGNGFCSFHYPCSGNILYRCMMLKKGDRLTAWCNRPPTYSAKYFGCWNVRKVVPRN